MELHILYVDIFHMIQLFHTIHYVIVETTKEATKTFRNNANYWYK